MALFTMKACSRCYNITDQYGTDKRASDGLQSQCKACFTDYRKTHPSKKTKEQARRYDKNWQENHPGAKAHHIAKRHAAKMCRTPGWLTSLQLDHIKLFYEAAKHMSLETGIPFEVDHIEPLQGKLVSGLHVPWNLQVLTMSDNVRKSNR